MCNHSSCAQVHVLPQSHSGDNREVTLFPWLYICTLMFLPQENFDWNKRDDWRRQWPKWNLTLKKRRNWSSCTKLSLSASWTHSVIVQSVRASERNSVVVGSNATQPNFLQLLQRILQLWILYIYIYVYVYVYVLYIYVCVSIYIYICVCVCVSIYIYICVCVCVCMYCDQWLIITAVRCYLNQFCDREAEQRSFCSIWKLSLFCNKHN